MLYKRAVLAPLVQDQDAKGWQLEVIPTNNHKTFLGCNNFAAK
jgi:hypothetical protein